MSRVPPPTRVIELGYGFWKAKVVLTAVQLGVFDAIDRAGPATVAELETRVGLHPRVSEVFLDALVGMDLLCVTDGRYDNTPEASAYLVSGSVGSLAEWFELVDERLYEFWGELETAVTTGEPTNELADEAGPSVADVLYEDEENRQKFVAGMTGLSQRTASVLAERFPWDEYDTLADLGTSEGIFPRRVAEAHDHLHATGIDLPRVAPHFDRVAGDSPAADRLSFAAADFFEAEELPPADVYVLGHILQDHGPAARDTILSKVGDAVRPGGAVVVYDNMIGDDPEESLFSLLVSVNMVVDSADGACYTPTECIEWLTDAGFEDARVERLPTHDTAVIAHR